MKKKAQTNYARWKKTANPNSATAKALRRFRKATGLSQRELGKRANFSQGYLGMIERGICQPRPKTLSPLIKALNRLGVKCSHKDFGLDTP